MNNKVILVTGGTGSFGQKFTEIVIKEHNPKARSEAKSSEQLPLVTIIIPSLNQGDFIERTLLSILKQDYPNKEIIVMDGASTDDTVDILRRYSAEVQWVSEKDKGYADAVNKGLRMARGEIIGIQSSDDYYTRHAIGEAANLLTRYPEASLVSGKRIHIDAKNQEIMRSGNQNRIAASSSRVTKKLETACLSSRIL